MPKNVIDKSIIGKLIGKLEKMERKAEVLETCVTCNKTKSPATNPINLVLWERCKEL